MSWHDYEESKQVQHKASFYGLVMAAMRRADTTNAKKLRQVFPDVWDELQARYNAPMGYLRHERPDLYEGRNR